MPVTNTDEFIPWIFGECLQYVDSVDIDHLIMANAGFGAGLVAGAAERPSARQGAGNSRLYTYFSTRPTFYRGGTSSNSAKRSCQRSAVKSMRLAV